MKHHTIGSLRMQSFQCIQPSSFPWNYRQSKLHLVQFVWMYWLKWAQFALSIEMKIKSLPLSLMYSRTVRTQSSVRLHLVIHLCHRPETEYAPQVVSKRRKMVIVFLKWKLLIFQYTESMAPISIFNRQSQINIMSKLYLWLNTWIGSNKRAIQMFNYIFGSFPTSSLTDCSSSRRRKKINNDTKSKWKRHKKSSYKW